MSDEAASAPSAGSVQRLAADVGGEVEDLRTRLHRALDEAGRLESEGRQDLAAAVLEEQREVLLSVHQRLQGRLADAAVEREAERVVAGATPAVGPGGTGPAGHSTPTVAGPAGAAVRLLAAVAAAAVGVVLLVTPELGSTVLTVAGLTGVEDPGLRDAAVSGPSDRPSTLGPSAAAPAGVSPTTDDHDTARSEMAAPARPHGAVDGEASAPSSPAGDGAGEARDGGDRSEFTDLTGFPGLVQEWIDGLAGSDRAAGDEQGDDEAEDESSPILPMERSDDGSGDAEPDDTASDDERFLGGR